MQWVKDPSHVAVMDDEEADRLSKMGRLTNPQCPTKATPALHVIHTASTPCRKRQK